VRACPPSKNPDGFFQHLITNAAVDRGPRHDIDARSEPFGEAPLDAGKIDQIEFGIRIVIDDYVYIARRLRFAARDRSEDMKRRHAACPQSGQLGGNQPSDIIDCHHDIIRR